MSTQVSLTTPFPSSGDIDAEGADGGRDAVPGHEVRQPDAAAHHAHPDRAGQRDRAPHPPVHHHRPEDQGHAAAHARQRRRRGGLSCQLIGKKVHVWKVA